MKGATKVGILLAILLLLVNYGSWAQESGNLTITDIKVGPSTVNPGGKALISCRVSHALGPTHIERVAATAFHGDWVTGYPMLYDDGTHGDIAADDGVYSLEISAADTPCEEKIVFCAVDKDRNEIETEPVILIVQ